MNCVSCGQALPGSIDPTERFIDCPHCGTRNDLAGVEEHTIAATRAVPSSANIRPPSRRSLGLKMVGRTLGQGMYRIDSEIGGGGMAKVYCATQLRLDRKVAVKILPQELTEDPSFVQRFQREALVLARFSHANIVPVFDASEEDGIYYIVMGYIEGPGGKAATLRDLIDAKPLEVEQAARIMRQCLSALQYAHEKQIIHRDIKPGNILIDEKGDAHLADFGIASSRGTVGDMTLTVSGSTLGTVRYMAPEQTESASRADARSDLYSLGLVFYEMLVGYVPETKSVLPGALVTKKKQSRAFVLPSTFKPGQIDERLDQFILRAIQPDPADRFQNATEMLDALSAAVSDGNGGGSVFRGRKRKGMRSRLVGFSLMLLIMGGAAAAADFYYVTRTRIPADLLAALKSGDTDKVVSLVDKQPDIVNRTDADGLTPLHHAAVLNLPEIAVDLLKHGAKLQAQDHKGRTPLHLAALDDSPAMVALLLGKGARQEAQDNDNKTAEQLAIDNKSKGAMLVFDRAGLIVAIGNHDRPTIDKLVTEEVAKSASDENWTALHYAAYKGDDYTSKLLLAKGALPDAQTTRDYPLEVKCEAGQTPLLLACQFSNQMGGNYAAVVEQLLSSGASPDLADGNGYTPLHYAVKNAAIDIANLLVVKAKPDAATKADGLTPLHLAAKLGNATLVNALLDHGASPLQADSHGLTALQIAAAAGHVDIVQILLPVSPSNDVRMAARKLADDNGQTAVVAEFDNWWNTEMLSAVSQESANPEAAKAQVTKVGELLNWPERRLNAVTRPNDGRNILAIAVAASSPNPDLLTLLLNAQPTLVDEADNTGDSPLYFAARAGRADLVSLLAAKADPKLMDATDAKGERLLNVAVASGAATEVDQLVTTYHLNVNAADKGGITPLQAAAAALNPDMVTTLLADGAKPDLACLDAAGRARAAIDGPSDDRADATVNKLSVILLTHQLSDPNANDTSVNGLLSKLDDLHLDVLEKPLPSGLLPLQLALTSGSDEAKAAVYARVKERHLINAQNAEGETVLHTIAKLGLVDATQDFLEAGADYTKKNSAGQTPEDVAVASNQTAAASTLSAWRTQQEKKAQAAKDQQAQLEAAAKAQEAKLQAQQQAQQDEALAQVASANRAADSANAQAARAWYQDISDRRQILSIQGVAKLDFSDAAKGGVKVTIVVPNEPDQPGTSSCDDAGILTVMVKDGELPRLGPGDFHKKTVPSGRTKIVGYETQNVFDKKLKAFRQEQVPVTEPDGTTKSIVVHDYTGPLVQKGPGIFEWSVGNSSLTVTSESR